MSVTDVRIDNCQLLTGNCIEVMRSLPSNSIHCIITSPPYWGLRKYGDDATNEIGREATYQEYVTNIVRVFREVKRVLRDDGIVWLNLGDTYATRGKGADNLIGIPWRVAFALQDDGWVLRQDIIWHKLDVLPEFARDRCVRSHEYIFLFAKQTRYFFDNEAIKEPVTAIGKGKESAKYAIPDMIQLNKSKRSVWAIPNANYYGQHFAVFPAKLVEPMVKAGTSSKGCCIHCGRSWKRIVNRERWPTRLGGNTKIKNEKDKRIQGKRDPLHHISRTTTLGWRQDCDCPEHVPIPCTVLDPFAGAFTTGLVCHRLNRSFIGIELYSENVEQGRIRLMSRGRIDRKYGQEKQGLGIF